MGKKTSMLKKIRYSGLALMIVGALIGFLIFTTKPLTPQFLTYFVSGTTIFILGSIMFMAYEIFVPEFWRGEWAPGPGHEYPPDP